ASSFYADFMDGETIAPSRQAILGEAMVGLSTSVSVSTKRARRNSLASLAPSLAPVGNTNLPSGRLRPQIVQSRSLFLPSAVIGMGNLLTSPFGNIVRRISQATMFSQRTVSMPSSLLKIASNHPGWAATVV